MGRILSIKPCGEIFTVLRHVITFVPACRMLYMLSVFAVLVLVVN
jgi:hypothetical protein